jgi:phosphonate transport system permease protein
MAFIDKPPVVRPPKPFFLRSWFGLVLALALIVAHVIGWQVAEINPSLLVQKAPDMGRIINQLLQPDIIAHDQHQILIQDNSIAGSSTIVENGQPSSVSQEVVPNVKVGNELRGAAEGVQAYKPTLTVSSGTVGPGQQVTVSGEGFRPNAGGELVWQFPGTNSYPKVLGNFVADANGKFSTLVNVPSDPTQVVTTFPNTISASQTWDVGTPYVSETAIEVLKRIVETIFLALMGTTFAIVVSIPLSFLAARNLMSHNLVSMTVYYIARTFLNVLRSIEVLILAVIFVAAVGIGPFAGVLALTLHSIATLGKLYSEAIESIDPGPIEAITATGANRIQVIIYAVLPQFIPQFISFTLYKWDINVRMSTIIGFVGGGGIGFILIQYINLLKWNQASTAIIAIAIVVIAMDYASARIRAAVI